MQVVRKTGPRPRPDARKHKVQGYLSDANRQKADAIIAQYQKDLGYEISVSDMITMLIAAEADRLGIQVGEA